MILRLVPARLHARHGSLLFALALLAGPVACGDDGGDDDMSGDETSGDGDGDATTGDGDGDATTGDGDGDVALSHAADIQPIWEANCVSACHEAGGAAGSVLDLSGDAYADIVGASSTQATGESIVVAGSVDESYLVAKLRGTQADFGGLGSTMPPAPAGPLPEETIATVEAWIAAGAAP